MKLFMSMAKTTAVAVLTLSCVSYAVAAEGDDPVRFSVDVFAEQNDNRDSVGDPPPQFAGRYATAEFPPKKEDQMRLGISPKISIFKKFDNGQLLFRYAPTFQYWDNVRIGDNETEWSHDLFAQYFYKVERHYAFKIEDNFKYIQDGDLYLGSESFDFDPSADRFDDENSHYDNRVGGEVSYFLSEHLIAQVSAYQRMKRYDDEDLSENGDEDEYGASAYIWKEMSDIFDLSLMGVYGSSDEENTDDIDKSVDTMTFGVAANYRFSEVAKLFLSYGYEFVMYGNDEFEDQECPTDLKAELDFAFSSRFSTQVGARYGITDSYNYPYASQDLTAIYGIATWRHTPKLSTTYRAEFRSTDYEKKYVDMDTANLEKYPDGSEDELYLRFGINCLVTPKTKISLYYSYTDVDSDIDDSYDSSTIGARASYEF